MSNNVFEASASGDLGYLQNNLSNLNDKNERGWTPLHFAARFGQLETVQFLKGKKVDLRETNSEGKTAAELAIFWGNEAIAKLLETDSKGLDFPDTPVSVFAGSPLNRYGWERNNPEFLSKLAKSPRSKYIVLSNQKALYGAKSIYTLGYEKIASIVDKVYPKDGFNQTNSDVILVFLGIDESQGKGQEGVAFWALDLTAKGKYEKEFESLIKELESDSLEFRPTLPHAFTMERTMSAILAQAASMIDWNARNTFCSACGKRTMMIEGGHKRSCIPSDTAPKCISHTGVQNFTYPRTDAVVITCIIHPYGEKILLGRQKRWPKGMYSCISGFIEAAESLEEAVRREAYEETGVIINRVSYHSSQPWPFPNSLMLGFHAEAISTDISFADDELESAQWFSRHQVVEALNGDKNAVFSMPPRGSLAYTLVSSWINDKKWQNKL